MSDGLSNGDANLEAFKPRGAQVTAEHLRFGAVKVLGLKVKSNTKGHQIKKMILDLLRQDESFGHYSCGACFNPITWGITMCPYCTATYGAHPPKIMKIMEQYRREQLQEAIYPDPEDYEDIEFEEVEAEFEDLKRQRPHVPAPNLDDSLTRHDGSVDPPPKPAAKDKKSSGKSKLAEKVRSKLSEDDKEKRRQQIRYELPYTRVQLDEIQRRYLPMIMKELGIDNPVQGGGDYVERIIEKQTEIYGTDENGLRPQVASLRE